MESYNYNGFNYKMVNKFFPKKKLSILAGLRSIGKTTFATRLGNWLNSNGDSVLYLSLAENAKYIFDNIRNRKIERFFVSDIPNLSLEEIHLIIEKHDFDVIIIDYIELMSGLEELRYLGRDVQLKHIIDSLSKLSHLYKIRIIAISSILSRNLGNIQTPAFEKCLPYIDDRMFLSTNLVLIHGKYHYENNVSNKKLDKMELIKYYMRTKDSEPIPTSYIFTYV